MKYFKLIFIVAVIAGLFYGVFRIIDPSVNGQKINPGSRPILNDLKEKVNKDWENANSWNQKVYDKNISDAIVNRKELDKESAGNYNALIDYTNQKVCNKLIEFLDKEFSSTNCSESKITQMKSNIDYFVKNNGTITASDPRISIAYSKIALYTNILSFGRRSFGLSPGFNINTGNWNDFSAYRDQQLSVRDNYKKNTYYSSLSHITDVKNSLSSVDNKLAEARNRFEISLSNAIISAYSSTLRTTENFDRLNNVYKKYYANYDDGHRLSAFRKKFKKEVEDERSSGSLR